MAEITAINPTTANDIKSLLWTPNLVPILSNLFPGCFRMASLSIPVVYGTAGSYAVLR